jgi:triphosphoribosyl-dephospho-CoA synthase
MPTHLTPGALARVACLLEATARKPGNVHRFRDFADSHYLDYALSAQAIGPALDLATVRGVGGAVLEAVRATRAVVSTNTNLGMVLLLAPLAAVPEGFPIQEGVGRVLRGTTVEDARLVFEAIRLANPGGLGSAPEQDVAGEPTVTLTEAMTLAAGRDAIARQYANGFADVLGVAVPCLAAGLGRGQTLETAIVATHLTLLARLPDTLIARKRGPTVAAEASRRAEQVLDAGWPEGAEAVRRLAELDGWLRADGHARNPGATADLVAAALFAALRDGTIRLPIAPGAWDGGTALGGSISGPMV